MKVTVPCHCGNSFDYEYDEEVIITPDKAGEIIHGRFMNANCPACGTTMKPEYPVMFTYPPRQMKIFFVPELQRDSFLRGKSPLVHKSTDRFVIGFMELAEKIKILDAGLDDVTVEGVKYYILSKIENENDIENEILVFFDIIKNGKIVFQIHGMKENEVGILNIGMDFYNKTAEKLSVSIGEEPFKNFLTPPYISVLRVYREYTDNIK